MGLGTSLLLIAVGAILRFAVSVSTHGFNLHAVGVILSVVGIVGLLISALWMTVWADRRRGEAVAARRDVAVRDTEVY
jgi:sulfite exporter TauE/SafE